jgi:2'-5' RNA ligase
MCRAQIEIHDLLERQYGLRVAGRFMPHATIKGFFKTEAAVESMVERLTDALRDLRSFEVYNGGTMTFGKSGIALDVSRSPGHERNPPLQALHEAALTALMPLVAADCDFTAGEWKGPLFHAHLTLAMADIPPDLFDEILAFLREAEPIGPPAFPAEVLHLYRFESDDWAGRWGETLRWELLHSWRLP